MDPDLARLCAIPGTHDLSMAEVAEVLQVSSKTVERNTRLQRIEAKRHGGRGDGVASRVRISRAAVVRYLVAISGGDKSVILAAVAAQCPQYLAAAQGRTPMTNAESATRSATKRPRNVLPFEHPDLFSAPATKASA